MADYKRTHSRHNVLHLKLIMIEINGKEYPVVDISQGGISIVDENWELLLYTDSKIEDARLALGPIDIFVDFKVVFLDYENRIFGIQITHYHDQAKKYLKNLTDCMEKSAERNGIKVLHDGENWVIKTKKFSIFITPEDFGIVKKSFFTKEEDIPFLSFAYVAGLSRQKWPVHKMLEPIIRSIESHLHQQNK